MSPRHFHKRQAAVLVLLIILAIGLYVIEKREGNLDDAEERSHPVGDIEQRVASKVQDQFAEVRVTTWGPHMTGRELASVPPWSNAEAVVRVKGIAFPNDAGIPFDIIYRVDGDRVKYIGHNLHGDRWKRKARAGEMPYNPPSHPPIPPLNVIPK